MLRFQCFQAPCISMSAELRSSPKMLVCLWCSFIKKSCNLTKRPIGYCVYIISNRLNNNIYSNYKFKLGNDSRRPLTDTKCLWCILTCTCLSSRSLIKTSRSLCIAPIQWSLRQMWAVNSAVTCTLLSRRCFIKTPCNLCTWPISSRQIVIATYIDCKTSLINSLCSYTGLLWLPWVVCDALETSLWRLALCAREWLEELPE